MVQRQLQLQLQRIKVRTEGIKDSFFKKEKRPKHQGESRKITLQNLPIYMFAMFNAEVVGKLVNSDP